MKKAAMLLVLVLSACAPQWMNVIAPERNFKMDQMACKREVLTYLPRPTIFEYPDVEQLRIAQVVWRVAFDKEVNECLGALGWEK